LGASELVDKSLAPTVQRLVWHGFDLFFAVFWGQVKKTVLPPLKSNTGAGFSDLGAAGASAGRVVWAFFGL
jgi:hypothetical protein